VRLILRVAITLLELAGKPGALPRDGRKVILGQLAPLLLDAACKLFPIASDLIPIHCVSSKNTTLEPAWEVSQENEYQHNHQHQSQSAAGAIAPIPAIRPRGRGA
jgi:hypothetical protein